MSPADRMLRSLLERDISSEASSVKSTFSSWDSCMAKAYCKWPVIAGIIVASLIILGIAACLISCLCCGYQCCRGCCGCCYDCCDCCGSSRRNRNNGGSKYADPPQPYYQQPPPPEPMDYGYRQPTAASASLASSAPPPAYRGPQTATFDQPSKSAIANEDELPPMPTWADAQTRHVENEHMEHEEVEMDNLEGIRTHAKSPLQHEAMAPAPAAGGLSRGMSRGGYTEVPGTYPSPHPSPRPMYDEGYSPNGGSGGYGGHDDHHDAYHADEQGGYYGAPTDTHYFNQQPHSPGAGTPAPGYGAPTAGYGPRPSPRRSPAPYRGFENQPPPRAQVPNFSSPRGVGAGAYGQLPSPRSPPPAVGSGYSPYDQQPQRQLTHSPPSPGVHPSMQPAMGSGYSPYDHPQQQQQQAPYGPPHTQSPPPGPAMQQGQYRAFSPRITSPPPHTQGGGPTSFLEDPGYQGQNPEDRPPSLLMAGRRAAPNSYRAV